MPKNLCCESLFTIQCILKDKIMASTLADIFTTRYSIINKEFVKKVYQVLYIKLQRLIKPK